MDIHTFKGKRRVGVTDISDFTDFQGIGRDPLYKRYSSVGNLVDKVIDKRYAHFLAIPDYDADNGEIKWYIDMWEETPERLKDLTPEKRHIYEAIKNDTIAHYRKKLDELSGEDLQIMACALRYINEDFIYCSDGKVYAVAWGMTPDNAKHLTVGELVHEAPNPIKIDLTFLSGENGKFPNGTDTCVVSVPQGCQINESDIPSLLPDSGYDFSGFYPNPLGQTATSPMTFKATYRVGAPPIPPLPEEPRMATVRFDAGTNGTLGGPEIITKPMGSMLIPGDIPPVTPMKGYEFTGWNFNPFNAIVNGDMNFTAMYRKTPGHPWWWWLLWILLALLVALGIIALCGVFKSCHHKVIGGIAEVPVAIVNGDTLDNNGYVVPIEIHDGKLPDKPNITAPVYEEGGVLPTIIHEPGLPPMISDRLILFIEDEGSIDQLADEFKRAYPGEQYSVIGFDRYVKSLTIKVPETEREQIKSEINQKISNVNFIVFDESVYEIKQAPPTSTAVANGWHLDAVKAPAGWQITKGSPSVKVAVVDDGIDRTHSIFKDRIVDPYNVFLQDNQLSKGEGHGTMVAGVAVGSLQYQGQGAAGIAPECSLMPVQVADNGYVTLSAMVSGIMYAVHQGADVVNISIGPQLQGLNILPIQDQIEISQTQFLNVARLWKKVCGVASAKNVILVFAAGNDDIISSIPPENRSQSCVVVGAVDERLYPASFTNYGYCTDISAPGTNIYSSFPVDRFNSMDGTSFSAPIVTGAIALMRSLYKDLNVEQAKNVLYRTGRTVYGFMPPMVQVPLALEAVKNKDFSRGPERQYTPVPVESGNVGDSPVYESWTVPGNVIPGRGTIVVGDGGPGIVVPVAGGTIDPVGGVVADPATGSVTGEDIPVEDLSPGTVPPEANTPAQPANDYSIIRDKIKRLKQEIRDLERQLPEHQR